MGLMKRNFALAALVALWGLCGCADNTLSTASSVCGNSLSVLSLSVAAGDDASLQRLVDSISGRVSAVRGLAFKEPVKASWVRRDHLMKLEDSLSKSLDTSSDSASINLADAFAAMGDVVDSASYVKSGADFDSSGVAAFYMDGTNHLWVLTDQAKSSDFQATVAHELVHALQDQNYGLAISDTAELDEFSAYEFVVEGDAEYQADLWRLGDTSLACVASEAENLFYDLPALIPVVRTYASNFPLVVSIPGYIPYTWGPAFVHALRKYGGWNEVNGFLAKRPTNSTEGLHPLFGIARQGFLDWDKNASFAAMSGWKDIGTGRFGELYLATQLYTWGASTVASQPALGWFGDRFWIWKKDSGYAVAGRTAWTDSASAQAFLEAWQNGVVKHYSGVWADTLLSGGNVSAVAARHGNQVLLVWGGMGSSLRDSLWNELGSLDAATDFAGRAASRKQRPVLHHPPKPFGPKPPFRVWNASLRP